MDLGSSKATICRIAESLPAHIQFIGGHPLAGREISGFDNSRWDLFFKKRFLLSTCARTPEPLLSQVESWLKTLGTIPIVVGAEDHDRLMALVSHFPQFYAIALANLLARNNPEEALNFLGGGIDDQMRLMISPFEIWHDVFEDNRAHMNTMLDQFIAILTQMKTDLNQDSLASWFETSHSIYHMYQEHKAAQYRVFSEN
jgi:prephenate dehydrogenase